MASTEFSFRPICRTQERLDSTPSRSLCRQLFGPIDHSQTQTDLKRELAKMNQEATLKWNFDFENDKPLEGNYLWRRIRSKESSTKASSSSVCCKTEESNSSRDVVASVESEANTNTDISSTKPELVFSDNDKQITAKRSGKKRPSSQKISDILKNTKRKPSDSKSLISKPLLGRRRSSKQQVQLCIKEFFCTDKATSSQA